MRSTLPLALLLCACAPSIHAAFDEAKREALAAPRAAPEGWQPDAVIRLAEPLLDEALTAVLETEANLSDTVSLGPIALKPKLALERIDLSAAKKCSECLSVHVALGGTVRVTSPLGTTRVPIAGTADFDVALEAVRSGEVWQVNIDPRSVRKVHLEAGDVATGIGDLAGPLQDWVDRSLVAEVPTITIADLGSVHLPLRAVAAVPAGGGVELRMLTDAGVDAAVGTDGDLPSEGWTLELAPPSLVALARRAAFEAEPLDYDIVVEPTTLEVAGEDFTLGLRIWRLKGRGWWRDYAISGQVLRKGQRVRLKPADVKEEGASKGAALIDPIAYLGRGVILKTIEEAVNTSLPSTRSDTVGRLAAEVRVTSIEGKLGSLALHGSLELSQAPNADPGTRRREKKKR